MKGRLLNAIPLHTLTGVGVYLTEKLAKIGLHSVQDLLFHLPLRYEDRTHLYNIKDIQPGQTLTVKGKITKCDITFGRRRSMLCQINDGTGTLNLRFFHFNAAMKSSLLPGQWVKAYGEIKRGRYQAEMIHPEYRILSNADINNPITPTVLTPVYPTTEGLGQTSLRKITDQALAILNTCPIEELLPNSVQQRFMSLPQALQLLHRPPPDVPLDELMSAKHPAQKRLIIEELLAHHLSMLAIRDQNKIHQALSLAIAPDLKNKFLATLPFTPTRAQFSVLADIEQDMQQSQPMMRLIQGDVGSGKTLVAAMAALQALAHHKQVALLAPTELLAEQHFHTFSHWFEPLAITVGWLAGKIKGKKREEQLTNIANGNISMIIGTHAIFQESVNFQNIALVIIDEQHRFGVHQRLTFWEKGANRNIYPHQLIMTATPIPRTLAMTAYADLDTSIIDELPPGRTPVKTVAIDSSRREEIINRVRQTCLNEGRQAYWVCTLIDESDILEAQAAEATTEELKQLLPQLRIGLIHGRMKPKEKQLVMQSFKQNELQLLVATTVIEVGVDIPNASLMIIENSERLGLAQLHQLRGRVGRGAVDSYCVLLYKSPLSQTAQKRLQVLRESNDGFFIAQRDLEIRGPGELMGTRQTGSIEFKIADVIRDQHMIPMVQEIAKDLRQHHPEHIQAIIARWLPEGGRYINA